MKNKIQSIINEIKQKKEELYKEYEKLKIKYWYIIKKRKIIFLKEFKEKNRLYKISLLESFLWTKIREFLSIPFIYAMIIPAVILDIFLFIYQQTALRLYKIPLVKRREYIIFERRHLDYLNLIQKINCLYCSYVNWLFSYAVEIAWRTEKYWCPIKYANRKKWWHDWEEYFADYWDPEWFKKTFHSIKEFEKLKEENTKKTWLK